MQYVLQITSNPTNVQWHRQKHDLGFKPSHMLNANAVGIEFCIVLQNTDQS